MQIQNNLPDSSRVWVYQANRKFNAAELSELNETLEGFNLSWEAHGTKLSSAIEIYFDQFIVVFVDESGQEATGCSIDKSVALMKSLEGKFQVELLDRMNLTYLGENGIENIRMADFQTKAQAGELTSDITVFNNLVTNKGEFKSNWQVPASASWHANLF